MEGPPRHEPDLHRRARHRPPLGVDHPAPEGRGRQEPEVPHLVGGERGRQRLGRRVPVRHRLQIVGARPQPQGIPPRRVGRGGPGRAVVRARGHHPRPHHRSDRHVEHLPGQQDARGFRDRRRRWRSRRRSGGRRSGLHRSASRHHPRGRGRRRGPGQHRNRCRRHRRRCRRGGQRPPQPGPRQLQRGSRQQRQQGPAPGLAVAVLLVEPLAEFVEPGLEPPAHGPLGRALPPRNLR